MAIANRGNEKVEKLYQAYSDTVYRIGILYMGNEQEAYDVVQDVFLKLLCHPRQFKDEEHEKAWILRVAINQCKDQLKSHWRKKRISWNEYQEGNKILPEDAAGGTEGHLEEKELIMEAVMQLPDIYKEVVLLHYYEGYQAEEIARVLHRNPSTIRSRLQKARELLKKSLKGEFL